MEIDSNIMQIEGQCHTHLSRKRPVEDEAGEFRAKRGKHANSIHDHLEGTKDERERMWEYIRYLDGQLQEEREKNNKRIHELIHENQNLEASLNKEKRENAQHREQAVAMVTSLQNENATLRWQNGILIERCERVVMHAQSPCASPCP